MLQIKNNKIANLRYVYYMMQNIKFNSETHKRYWISEYSNIEIPLPPLSVQEEIVKELDQYQAIIDGAQKVVDNWKPSFEINPEWEKVKLGDVCRVLCGYAFKSTDFVDIGVQLIKMGNVKRCCFDYNNNPSYLPTTFVNDYEKYILRKNDLLISMTGTNGKEDYGNVCQVNTDKIYAILKIILEIIVALIGSCTISYLVYTHIENKNFTQQQNNLQNEQKQNNSQQTVVNINLVNHEENK